MPSHSNTTAQHLVALHQLLPLSVPTLSCMQRRHNSIHNVSLFRFMHGGIAPDVCKFGPMHDRSVRLIYLAVAAPIALHGSSSLK